MSRRSRVPRWSLCILALGLAASAQPAAAAAAGLGAPGDTRPPAAPAGLAVYGVTGTSVNLSWRSARDNTGVVAYDLYAGASLVRSVAGTSATFPPTTWSATSTTGLTCGPTAGTSTR